MDLLDLAPPWSQLTGTIRAVADDVVAAGMWVGVADSGGRLLWQAGAEASTAPIAIARTLELARPTEARFAPVGTAYPDWFCAAAPVRDLHSSRLAGCLAIAGPRDAAWSDVVMLARLTAITMEAELQQALALSA